MRVLVTGGGGFIGSHLVGASARSRASRSASSTTSPPGGARTCADSTARSSCRRRHPELRARPTTPCAGCEVVFHQAALPVGPALDPGPADEQRDERDRHAQRAARRPRRAASAASCSRPRPRSTAQAPELPKREDRAGAADLARTRRPSSPASATAAASPSVYGLETVALRYFNVFGPRQDPASQYAAVIPSFISAAARRPAARSIYGDGEQSRDFTYVDNVGRTRTCSRWTRQTSRARSSTSRAAVRVTVNRLVRELQDLLGVDVEPAHEARRPGEIEHSVADLSLARRELGYEPVVPLRAGLERTIQHFREEASAVEAGRLVPAFEP